LLNEASALLAADLAPARLFESLCELLARFIDSSVVFIALHDGTELRMAYIHDHGEIRRSPDNTLSRQSRSWRTLRTGRPLVYRQASDWDGPRYPINDDRPWTDDSVSAMFVPLRAGGDRLGVLSVQSTHAFAYDENDLTLLEAIARYLAIAVRNQQLFERVRRVSELEPLTGLLNHSRLLEGIDEQLRDLGRDQLAIVQLDVTNFGLINDTYGTAQGDRVLVMIADRLRSLIDSETLVGRLGGDDFAIVARRGSRAEIDALLLEITQRMRLSLTLRDVIVPISVNGAYVIAPDEGRTRSALVSLGDLRLRLSKQLGGRMIGEDSVPTERFGEYGAVEPIVEAALMRDPYTRVHLIHVNHLAHAWAPLLELSGERTEVFVRASLLHDIGKLLIPDAILLKPARLTREEFATMQRHAAFGSNILSVHAGFEEVAHIVHQHHEWYSGGGYPTGIAREAIHPLARAVSIIDAFSAMTVDRPYHLGITEREALIEIERFAGSQFDPDYAASFVAMRRSSTGEPFV
jgi:diguanylate cyclase (GGDEF)-like protein